jgi:uroporphyrinogen-III synthase
MQLIYLFSTSAHPEAISINSLEISFLKPKIDFSNYDYLIITSKQAVNALKQYDSHDYQTKKALCISDATAESSQNAGITLLEVGEGYGDKLINIIQKYPKTTKWLYLRAQTVASDLTQICKNDGYVIDESIVYKSECSKILAKTTPEDDAILIFTSPSAVKCFLNHHMFTKEHYTVVIGKTTAKSLPEGTYHTISPEPTIASCINLAKIHQNSHN